MKNTSQRASVTIGSDLKQDLYKTRKQVLRLTSWPEKIEADVIEADVIVPIARHSVTHVSAPGAEYLPQPRSRETSRQKQITKRVCLLAVSYEKRNKGYDRPTSCRLFSGPLLLSKLLGRSLPYNNYRGFWYRNPEFSDSCRRLCRQEYLDITKRF